MPIGTKRAAERLGIKQMAVVIAIRQGRLQATRLGREYMIMPAELERYIRDHQRPSMLNLAKA